MVDLGAWFAEEHRISADEEGRESSPQSDSRD